MGLFKKKAEIPKGNIGVVEDIIEANEDYVEEPQTQSIDDEMKLLQEKIAKLQKQKEIPKPEAPKGVEPTPQELLDIIEANQVRNAQLISYFRRRFGV